MNAEKTVELVGFLTGFDLCKAVDDAGAIRSGSRGARIELRRGLALAAGSFAVQVLEDDDEHLCFGPEWSAHRGDVAIFEPCEGVLEPGQVYLWGRYDPFHRWLDGAWVDRFAGEICGKLVFHGDGETPDLELCPARSECVIVGRFAGMLRGNLIEGFAEIPSPAPAVLRKRRVHARARREDFRVIEGRTLAA